MKILYLDMDGVLADFDKFVQPRLNGNPRHDHRVIDKIMAENPHMFECLALMPNAREAVLVLREFYDIYFLSTPVSFVHQSYAGKRLWIQIHFGEWADKRLILTHRKDLCIGDVLVDDRLKNGAEAFKGHHVHFGTEKFPNWGVVLPYLVEYAKVKEAA